jgi:hypothetical protein
VNYCNAPTTVKELKQHFILISAAGNRFDLHGSKNMSRRELSRKLMLERAGILKCAPWLRQFHPDA